MIMLWPCRRTLSPGRPLKRVMSAPLMASTLLQLVVVVGGQLAGLGLLGRQPGYSPSRGTTDLRLAQVL